MAFGKELRQIAVAEQADTQACLQQDAAFFVEVNGIELAGRFAGMADEATTLAAGIAASRRRTAPSVS